MPESKPVPNIWSRCRSATSTLTVTDAAGAVLMHAPVTSGSEHDPLPIGSMDGHRRRSEPDVQLQPRSVLGRGAVRMRRRRFRPGPTARSASVWIDISKPHYGIHGTPEPGDRRPHLVARLRPADELGRVEAGRDGRQGNQGGVHRMKGRRDRGRHASWLVFAAAMGFLARHGGDGGARRRCSRPARRVGRRAPLMQAAPRRSKSSRRRKRSRRRLRRPPATAIDRRLSRPRHRRRSAEPAV